MSIVTQTNADNWTVRVTNPNGQASNTFGFQVVAPVGGTPAGTLTASPTTCQVTTTNGTCTISLTWTTQYVSAAQIWYTATIGPETPVTTGLSGASPVAVQALPQHYVFHLWDYSNGSRGAELKNLSVSATGPGTTASNPAIRVDPQKGTPGTTFTITGSGLAGGAAKVYVQVPGASSGTVVGQPNVGSDGTFTFLYTTQLSSTLGSYTVWAVDSASSKSPSG